MWAQARGFPSWPGKVVDASEVGKSRADEGKVKIELLVTAPFILRSLFGLFSQLSVYVGGHLQVIS